MRLALGACIVVTIAASSLGVCRASSPIGPGVGHCSFPNSAGTDGCSTANWGATTSVPNFFTGYARQSGQRAYAVRPAWNVAGVDYPVGYYTPLNQLIDARLSPPPGCGLRTFGVSVAVQCAGSGPLNISGYRFDLYGGTWLIINGAGYTSIAINDSYFKNGPNTDRLDGAMLVVEASNADLVVTSSTFDGDGQKSVKGLSYIVEDDRTGAQRDILTHNAFFRIPQKGIGSGPCGDTYITGNYFEEIELSPSHGEFTIDGTSACTKNNLVESYNTGLITSSLVRTGSGGITSLLYLSGYTLRSWNTIVASHNTLVANNIGSANVWPGLGGPTTSRMIEENWGNVYQVISYSNNYMDPTGSLLCFYAPTPAPASTIYTGNVNLLDGSIISDTSSATCNGHHP